MSGLKQILVYGLGSDILTDAGIGPKLIDWLTLHCDHPEIIYKKAPLFMIEFLFSMQGFSKIFFIDCIIVKDQRAGTFDHYTINDFKPSLHVNNIHDHPLIEIQDIADETNFDITDDIHFITINVNDVYSFGEDLTPEVEDAFPMMASQIREIILKQLEPNHTKITTSHEII